MGLSKLLFKARLDGVSEVQFSRQTRWYFVIVCVQCNERNEKDVQVRMDDEVQMAGSRGVFNFVTKCKFCERVSSLSFAERCRLTYSDSECFEEVAEIDGRGLRIERWYAEDVNIVTNGGRTFQEVVFEEGDWVEFDEDQGALVGVYEVSTKVGV